MSKTPPPETIITTSTRVFCGGAALGHPRVWLEIDEKGFVECSYCDRRFVLKDGVAEAGAH